MRRIPASLKERLTFGSGFVTFIAYFPYTTLGEIREEEYPVLS
jgi:hypothetical protein